MKKRISAIVLTLSLILTFVAVFPLPTFAATSGKCGDNVTWTLSSGTLTIKGTGKMNNLYNNNPWMEMQSEITNVVIESGVTSIGNFAFYGFTNIKSVTIPNTVEEIGNTAFHYCESLESVTLPDSVTTLGKGVFRGCSSMKSFDIPEKITIIPETTFAGCSMLAEVTIPNSVKTIGYNAFSHCNGLKNLVIPDSVTEIEDQAFSECKSLESITLSKNITKIGDYTFNSCTSLTSITIPDMVTQIGEGAFWECSSLKNVTLSKNLKSIGEHAFGECAFEKIVLPKSLTEISDWAFSECTNLTEITIPENVTNCGENLFYDCDKLKSVKILGNITQISSYMFCDCDSLTSFVIPDGVTSVGSGAFSLTSLETVTIPKSVISISDGAFGYAGDLKDVYYAGSEEEWKNQTYSDIYSFEYVTMHYNYFDKSSGATAGNKNTLSGKSGNEISLYVYENKKDSSTSDNEYRMSRNATVTNGTSTVTTSSIGKAVITKNGKDITISKKDFVSRTIPEKKAVNIKKIFLQPDKGNKPIINAVWMGNTDVMGEEVKFDILSKDSITLEADVYWKSGTQSKIYLMQDSKRAEFTGKTLTTVLSDNFDVSKTIYIVCEDTSGNATKKKLKIKPGGVYDDVNNLKVTVGDYAKFAIPDNIPVLGGHEIGIDFPMLPITVTFENNKFYAVLGLDVRKARDEYSYIRNVNGSTTLTSDESTKYLFENIKNDIKSSVNKVTPSTLKQKWLKAKYNYTAKIGFETDLTVIGYVEGYVDANKKINILEGGVGINPSASMSLSSQFWATPPVYWEASIKGEIEAMLNLYMNETAKNFTPGGSLGGKVTLTGGVGVGVSGVVGLSAGISGNLGVKYDMYYDRQNYFAFTGAIGAYAKGYVGPVTFLDVKENFAEGIIWDYPSTRAKTMSLMEEKNIYSADNFELTKRDYINDISEFTANDAELFGYETQSKIEKVFKTNVYPYAEPQIVEFSDGEMIAVWLDDDNEREDINRTALYYSHYNGITWSEPAQVNNDGTGDFSPQLEITGGDAYVVWVNANKELKNTASTEEMFSVWDISAAKFDRTRNMFADVKFLTQNDTIDMMPTFCKNSRMPTVAWVSNYSNNIFSEGNDYSIYLTGYRGGDWLSPELRNRNLKPIDSIACCTDENGSLTVAYTIDSDGNQSDCSDKEIYINGNAVTNNNILDSKPQFANNKLYFYSNGGIKAYDLSTLSTLDVASNVSNDRFKVLANGNSEIIVFSESNDLVSELYAIIYNAEEGKWGEKIKISNFGSNIDSFSGVLSENGIMKFIVSKTEIDKTLTNNDPFGKTDISLFSVVPTCDLIIGEAVYHEDLFVGGNTIEFYLPITNSGELAVKNYKVEVIDGNGNVLAHTYNETTILPGEVQDFTAFYPLDENIEPHSVTLRVVPIGFTEENINNNTVSVSLNCENISLENIDFGINENDNAVIYAEIVNRGYTVPDKITASLRKGNNDGEVIDTYIVNEKLDTLDMEAISFEVPMNHGEVYYITLDCGESDFVVLQAESDFAQFDLENNTLLINSTSSYKNAKMIVASYNEGKLVDFKLETISIVEGDNTYQNVLSGMKNGDTTKVFVWENLSSLEPIFNCSK